MYFNDGKFAHAVDKRLFLYQYLDKVDRIAIYSLHKSAISLAISFTSRKAVSLKILPCTPYNSTFGQRYTPTCVILLASAFMSSLLPMASCLGRGLALRVVENADIKGVLT